MRWTAALPLPDSPVPLQLRVDEHPRGGFGYAVHPGPEGVPAWVHHATPALRFGSAGSLPAAIALAEHAGREVAAGARAVRSVERRLLVPRPVPADADPQSAELIAAAAPREMVLDLYELCAGLRVLADLDGQDDPYLYNPPAGGHWRQGENGPEPGAVSAMLGEDHVLAATRPGEPANTAAVDSPAYRRHLAAHAGVAVPRAGAQRQGLSPGDGGIWAVCGVTESRWRGTSVSRCSPRRRSALQQHGSTDLNGADRRRHRREAGGLGGGFQGLLSGLLVGPAGRPGGCAGLRPCGRLVPQEDRRCPATRWGERPPTDPAAAEQAAADT
ncbi:hypothetical protein ACFU7Y_37225, partial [Kitasatospora sp. NPDC057542]|uniref:hypothetical protein n=1 Tax=Kitasatospora sp. NPDC057542 TaxID=3346162 RepID=UPI0036B4ED76